MLELRYFIKGCGIVSKTFRTLKTLNQYVRRNKMDKYHIYKAQQRYVIFNKKLINLKTSVKRLQELQNSTLNPTP